MIIAIVSIAVAVIIYALFVLIKASKNIGYTTDKKEIERRIYFQSKIVLGDHLEELGKYLFLLISIPLLIGYVLYESIWFFVGVMCLLILIKFYFGT